MPDSITITSGPLVGHIVRRQGLKRSLAKHQWPRYRGTEKMASSSFQKQHLLEQEQSSATNDLVAKIRVVKIKTH